MRVYLFIAAIAGGATWLVTPLIRHVAIRIGAVGQVRSRDVHTVPTPRMGGVAMMVGYAVAMLFASHLPFISGLFAASNQAWVILGGAVLICLLGVADDLWDLDWMLKLGGQLLISVLVSWGGVQIISLPLGSLVTASPSLSMAITAFLIVASINAVNFVDGLDGLASGIVAIGGIAFAVYSYIIARTSPSYASMATLIDVALVGICVGFILHNWHPAKLFMGDSGSMLLGYLITCASIVMTGRLDPVSIHTSIYLPVFMPILLPILVLFLPVLDMLLAVVRRVSHGQSPMHPDRMHLHHRMLKIGHSVQSAVLILWGWAALIAFGSIMILFFEAEYVAIGFIIASIALTVVTLYPYYRRRIPEIRAENAALAAAKRRERAQHAQSQEAKAEIDASMAAEQTRNKEGHVGPETRDSRQSDSLTSDSSGRDATSHRHARDDFDDDARHGNHEDTVKQD
ncbi:MAG: MraY family glycosyltransferase [Bifidobacterium crudilactis]|jgi:UDP-GlcNAc:undecaprenyl-phosphate GlcNAc-1-phosphate transferase|nr:MraY family glycosyltransferase [Bifidobacterium crudilactis]MCI1218126.1 undecaprenyl/decaprenyl-phosphate alpha-N-acetylglucosaminyl 1-phosphate transferase [Bifidobacterium crudilactis]